MKIFFRSKELINSKIINKNYFILYLIYKRSLSGDNKQSFPQVILNIKNLNTL